MSQVALTRQVINAAPSVKELLEIKPVRDNFVSNYKKVTGKPNGEMIFEREKILFMKTLQENKTLETCDKFSIYASFIELAVSGLTLNEAQCYIVPYKGYAKFTIGWKVRLEQINRLSSVIYCNEPTIVYDCDAYEEERGESIKIYHKPAKNRPDDARITHVYFVIQFTHGTKTYVMNRKQIIDIRDNYSQSYKTYAEKLRKGEKVAAWELPTWVTSEEEMFKKTIIKRTFKYLPKDEYLKKIEQIDNFIKQRNGEDEEVDTPLELDYGLEENGSVETQPQEQEPTEETTAEEVKETVEEKKPEVSETETVMQHKKTAEKKAKEAAKTKNYYNESF